MHGRLSNKTALITGGTSGIGRATALLFAREGAQVAITGRRVEKGNAVVAQITSGGGQAIFIPCDHTDPVQCQQAVEQTVIAFGKLDILFNNAGIVTGGNAEAVSEEDWQATLDLNVTAVWRMSRLALPHLRKQGGAIVNNASDWGLVGGKDALAYCASKGAVVQITRSMALDHAHEHIRINAVCPGDTFVERWQEDGYFSASGPVDTAEVQRDGTHLPIGRVATADEIAQAVLFLASDEASYITGACLAVDGGNTAR